MQISKFSFIVADIITTNKGQRLNMLSFVIIGGGRQSVSQEVESFVLLTSGNGSSYSSYRL